MKKRGHAYKTRIEISALNKPVFEFDPSPADWKLVWDTWCSVRPARKAEVIDGQQVASAVTHLLHLRYLPGIQSSMRVKVVDENPSSTQRVFYIDSVVNLQDRGRRLVLLCEERYESVYAVDDDPAWIWQNADEHIWQDDSLAIWSA